MPRRTAAEQLQQPIEAEEKKKTWNFDGTGILVTATYDETPVDTVYKNIVNKVFFYFNTLFFLLYKKTPCRTKILFLCVIDFFILVGHAPKKTCQLRDHR